MRFLIQTNNKKITDDFSFVLIQALNYQNWYNPNNHHEYRETDSRFYPKYTPVGSVEFVQGYIEHYHGKTVRPMNIPEELFTPEFLQRNMSVVKTDFVAGKQFVKSNTRFKSFTEICEDRFIPYDEYLFSDVVEFKSEWRCFVYQKQLVGLHYYAGDFTVFPCVPTILNMIHAFKSAPVAYTLDVGVIKDTVLVECHDFFSCGLYGFNDYKILPQMFQRWFTEFILTK